MIKNLVSVTCRSLLHHCHRLLFCFPPFHCPLFLCVEKNVAIDFVVEGNRLLRDAIMNIHEQPMDTFNATALSRGYIVSRLLAVVMLIIPPGFD